MNDSAVIITMREGTFVGAADRRDALAPKVQPSLVKLTNSRMSFEKRDRNGKRFVKFRLF